MKIGIMQPYFFPYIGYFQLMNTVDEFVIYNNIQYTKKGWVNRNRILENGKDSYITLPIRKDSNYLDIVNRRLAEDWPSKREKILRRLVGAYSKAPEFEQAFSLVEMVLKFDSWNLFDFLIHSLHQTKVYLGILTPLIISSSIQIDHSLRSEEKVITMCKARNATKYINPIGGTNLYLKSNFEKEGIDIRFIDTDYFIYKQFSNEGFVRWLSIIDVMMFNPREKLTEFLNYYTLVEGIQ